jgi:formate dehydrogenase subunit delta
MNIENLIDMADRIGEYFSVYPDRADGERQIANHLQRFWEPRMRRALLAHVQDHAGEGLSEIVLSAVRRYKDLLTPGERLPNCFGSDPAEKANPTP